MFLIILLLDFVFINQVEGTLHLKKVLNNLYYFNLHLKSQPEVYINIFKSDIIKVLVDEGILDTSHNYLFYDCVNQKYHTLTFNKDVINIEYPSYLYIKLQPYILIEKK